MKQLSLKRHLFGRMPLALLLPLCGALLGTLTLVHCSNDIAPGALQIFLSNVSTSRQAALYIAFLYSVCMLSAALPVLYPVFCFGLFLNVFVAAYCTSLLLSVFGACGAVLCAWFFLPRFLMLCLCSVHSGQRRHLPRQVILDWLGMMLVLAAQFLLYPLFVAPLLRLG